MSPDKFCVNCGAPLEAGQNFCPSCGQPTDSLPEDDAGDVNAAEGPEAAVPPPPPPSSGGLRPVASSSVDDEAQRPPQRSASPPPPPRRPSAPQAESGGSAPPLGGQGGPVGSQPARPAPPRTGGEKPKKSNKALYWGLGIGCLAILVAIIVLVVITLRGAGGVLSESESTVGGVEAPAERAVTVEARPAGTPAVARGELLYEEDFSDASSGWDEFSGADQTVGYEGGRYVILIDATNWMSWGNAYRWFDDGIVVEVDATKVGGPDDNGFGLVFGYQDGGNFYRYEIASDGYYRLGKYVNDEWIELIPWMETDQLVLGDATNTIAAEIGGGTIVLYANGELLGSTLDSTFAEGDVGLVAGSFDEPGVQIAFDNLRVYASEGSSASVRAVPPTKEPVSDDVPATEGSSFVTGSRGELLYSDDFSDPGTGWDEYDAPEQSLGYVDGSYLIEINIPEWMTWGNAYQWFDDGIAIEVDATKIGGPDDNGFGIIFGYQDVDNFYRYEIASDGYYRLGKYVNDEWIELIPWMETDQVNLGDATNAMAVEMGGGTISLYVNGVLLDTITDRSFADGDVGLVAGSFDMPGVQIAFDGLRVYALESSSASTARPTGAVIPGEAAHDILGAWYGVDEGGIEGYFQFLDDGTFRMADPSMGSWAAGAYRVEKDGGETWLSVLDPSDEEWYPFASFQFVDGQLVLTNTWDESVEMQRISDEEMDAVLAQLAHEDLF